MNIRKLTLNDAAPGLALTQAVGWQPGLAQWRRVLEWGAGCAFGIEDGGQLVATTLGIRYSTALAWVAMVITHPDHQRRGYARRLMEAVMDQLSDVACVMLDATDVGLPLYEKLGFRAIGKIEIWTGAGLRGEQVPDLRPLTSDDLPHIIGLDAASFGVSRPHVIERLLVDSQGWRTDDGFVLVQMAADDWTHVGPWAARSSASAARLLAAALHTLAGRPFRLEIKEHAEPAHALVRRYGLRYDRCGTRMVYGAASPPTPEIVSYGLLSLATG